MYFYTNNSKFNYFFQVILIAFLGYNLFYLFGIVKQQLIDVWYSYGLILHFPVWIIILMISELFIKIKLNHRLLIIGSGLSIITILILLNFFQKSTFNSDYLTILFYAVDYIFCFSIFSYLRKRNEKTSQKN
jgi:hypothetical protein